MSYRLDRCPICDKQISTSKCWDTRHLHEVRTWNCTHTEEQYRAALEKMHEQAWDASIETMGDDA
jgi:hypothetical protein